MPARSSHRPSHAPIVQQIEAADKVLSFAKLLLGMFAGLLLWAARLQWTQADQQRQITETNVKVAEIQEDRRTKIKDADTWRHDVDLANVHRDEAIARLANAQTIQTAQAESARAVRNTSR